MVELEIAGTVELAPPYEEGTLSVHVRLEDATMLDAPSQTIAEVRCNLHSLAGGTAAFTLIVDDGVLDPRHDYILSARAEHFGPIKPALYGTVQSYPWTANDNRPQRLRLRRLY